MPGQLESRRVEFTAEDFERDPGLYRQVEKAWREQQWFMLFGELPVGAVLASLRDEGGITFRFKVRPSGAERTRGGW